MYRKSFLIFISTALVACSSTKIVEQSGKNIYQNSAFGYSIEIPDEIFTPQENTEGERVYFGNTNTFGPKKTGTYDVFLASKDSPCQNQFKGVSEVKDFSLDGIGGQWGRVDYWEKGPHGIPGNELLPQPECRSGGDQGAAYLMCTEKGAETITVCVSQVTDNPDLAKQIFETFRWTE